MRTKMPKEKKPNIKNEIKKELSTIADTVDLDSVNQQLDIYGITKLDLSKKTLMNIGKWVLDGKSEFEIRQNLELTDKEWRFLIQTCPAIVVVMQHSMAYAEMIVGGTLFQVAIGGKKIKKKIPLKVHDYEIVNGKSVVVGEHYEMVEVEEESQPNPYLLKYLSENKLSENFGNKQKDHSKDHDDIVDAMTQEEINAINEYNKNKGN